MERGELAVEQVLRPGNALAQARLEGRVLTPGLDVLGDRRADYFRHWLGVDGRDHFELLARQPHAMQAGDLEVSYGSGNRGRAGADARREGSMTEPSPRRCPERPGPLEL
jgi:hypothetical protein